MNSKDKTELNFAITSDCIACDTCHSIAPNCFKLTDDGDHAIIYMQPVHKQDHLQAIQALNACPVGAIYTKPNINSEHQR